MTCPNCIRRDDQAHAGDAPELVSEQIEDALYGRQCPRCGGTWLEADAYHTWVEQLPPDMPRLQTPTPPLEAEDVKRAKLCPASGHIMIRYRIQPDLDLWIDHCGGCNGMWFDNNEWAYLRHHGLHRHLHFYFTDAWQTRLRQEEKRRQRRRRYEEQFGADTLARLDALRNWLHGHAHADALIAYLAAEDPYA